MGRPQPLNALEQKIPSFEPSTSKAIRIQRVVLPPVKQQFIKNLLCFAAGVCNVHPKRNDLRFCLFYYIIFYFCVFCERFLGKRV